MNEALALLVNKFRPLIANEKFWDETSELLFRKHGEALEVAILQNREEVLWLCAFIEEQRIESYLEIGVWTGGLLSLLHRLFRFEKVAACDHRYAEKKGLEIDLPRDARVFWGHSDSEDYLAFREDLGAIDMVFIDGNHNPKAVRRDFEINQRFPGRFLVLHDISGARPQTEGVANFWSQLEHGYKIEILRPHREMGLDHTLMGIGIWSAEPIDSSLDPRRLGNHT